MRDRRQETRVEGVEEGTHQTGQLQERNVSLRVGPSGHSPSRDSALAGWRTGQGPGAVRDRNKAALERALPGPRRTCSAASAPSPPGGGTGCCQAGPARGGCSWLPVSRRPSPPRRLRPVLHDSKVAGLRVTFGTARHLQGPFGFPLAMEKTWVWDQMDMGWSYNQLHLKNETKGCYSSLGLGRASNLPQGSKCVREALLQPGWLIRMDLSLQSTAKLY
nr:uncharacterized protein LOC114101785 [Marmota flaviventris]